jgi:hypothetical protein
VEALNTKTDTIAASVAAETVARTAAVEALNTKADTIAASVAAETATRTAAVEALNTKADTIAASVAAETATRTAAVEALTTKVDGIPALLTAEEAARDTALSDMKSEILREIGNNLIPLFAMLRDFEAHRPKTGSTGFFQDMDSRMGLVEKLVPEIRRDSEEHANQVKSDVLQKLTEIESKCNTDHSRVVGRIATLEHAHASIGTSSGGTGGGAASDSYTICINRLDGLESTVGSLCMTSTVADLRSKLDEHMRKCEATRSLVDVNIETLKNIARTHTDSSDKVDSLEAIVTALNASMKCTDTTISGLSSTVNGYTDKLNSLAALKLEERVKKLEGTGADEADNMGASLNVLSENIQRIESRLEEMDKKIDSTVSRPSASTTTGGAVGDLLNLDFSDVAGEVLAAAVERSPGDGLGVKPVMASTDPAAADGGEDGKSILAAESSFEVDTPEDSSSEAGSYDAGDGTNGKEVEFEIGAEAFNRKRALLLKKYLDEGCLRHALSQISGSVLRETRTHDDFTDDEIEWAYQTVLFPVAMVDCPFPLVITMDDPLDENWFQGSETKNLDSIMCSFGAACVDGLADADYMFGEVWPVVISQLLTYDADFSWARHVRDAILAYSPESI